jgi:hypothetical protein
MGQLSAEAVSAFLAAPDEIPAALAWAERWRHDLVWDEATLTLRLRLTGRRADGEGREAYLIEGVFDDYRLLPPLWEFLDPRDGAAIGPAAYPTPGAGVSSVLHSNALVCAHWSRRAYGELQGPHGNWGALTNWESVTEGTQAHSIPEMLARLAHEVDASSDGRSVCRRSRPGLSAGASSSSTPRSRPPNKSCPPFVALTVTMKGSCSCSVANSRS